MTVEQALSCPSLPKCSIIFAALCICLSSEQSNTDAGLQVRLTGSAQYDGATNRGMVEVKYDNVWGTICSDHWDLMDADVVCRYLGYKGAAFATIKVASARDWYQFNLSNYSIVIENLECDGRENNLAYCPFTASSSSCGSSNNVAGVECNPTRLEGYATIRPTYTHVRLTGGTASVRLTGGTVSSEGVVEVLYMGEWGVICAQYWVQQEGDVICHQLGYSGATSVMKLTENPRSWSYIDPSRIVHEYSDRIIQLHLLEVETCSGDEQHFAECNLGLFGYSHINSGFCNAEDSVVVKCAATTENKLPFTSVRLTGGGNAWEGAVEIFYNNQWGLVCDDSWDMDDGQVVCRQLGFPHVVLATTGPTTHMLFMLFGQAELPKRVFLSDVDCQGSEASLNLCSGNVWYEMVNLNCPTSDVAGVRCASNDAPDQTIRLADGSYSWEGRVEVYFNGQWGTVCDDNWDIEDANVVCRQLGYLRAINTFDSSKFPVDYNQALGPILLDNTDCSGTESKLTDCNGLWGESMHNCDHAEDAGVECDPNAGTPDVRLVGAYPNQGRVEIYLNGEWGTICDDEWDMFDADVVCRQLGFSTALQAVGSEGDFQEGTGPIWLDDVNCRGEEHYLFSCRHTSVHNCDHYEDAGVLCQSTDYPNYIVLDQTGSDNSGLGLTVMGAGIAFGFVVMLCFCCRKMCNNPSDSEATTTTVVQAQSVNNPYTAALEGRNTYMQNRAGPPAAAVPLLHVQIPNANPQVTVPSAPDLPPAYDAVMEDPNKFLFPPPQIGSGGANIPLTPPPEYTPQAVVFNANTNNVTMNTFRTT